MTTSTSLTIRALEGSDIPHIVKYFYEASSVDLDRMGIDQTRLTNAAEMTSSLMTTVAEAKSAAASAYYLVWQVDGQPIGFSSLKDITPSRQAAGMHLHMWNALSRGQGFGATFFCLSVLEFYRLSGVAEIVCEPSAANPLPNRMLQRVGFPLLKSYRGRSSYLCAEIQLNRYDIRKDIAESYLKTTRY